MTAPVLFAPEGELCGTCGSPLAADQRYCLTCGTRRADARLPFLDILRHEGTGHVVPFAAAPAFGGPAAPVVPVGLTDRARANTGLIASVGVLLLAMLIGVLVGSGFAQNGNVTAAADQKPVVVSVGGVAAVPAAATAGTDTTAAAAATAGAAPKKKGAKASKQAAAQKSRVKVTTASKGKLKSLNKLSGAAYQKQIDKLGKNIAVGGKAPPKDNKPAAAGGSFQEIG
jgi:hypothetical protein